MTTRSFEKNDDITLHAVMALTGSDVMTVRHSSSASSNALKLHLAEAMELRPHAFKLILGSVVLADHDTLTSAGLRDGDVISVMLCSSGAEIITASRGHDHTARIWDSKDGECLFVLGHRCGVSSALLSGIDGPRPRFALTGCMDGAVRLWRAIVSQ